MIKRVEDKTVDKVFVIRTTKTTNEVYGDYADPDAVKNGKVKVNGITPDEAKKTEAEIYKGNLTGEHMKNIVELKSSKQMAEATVIANKDDGTGGLKPGNNQEHAGYFTTDGVKEITPNKSQDPATGNVQTKSNADFHVHNSGTNDGFSWEQPPSSPDIINAGKFNAVRYVFAQGASENGGKLIYVYDASGVIATLPINTFKK